MSARLPQAWNLRARNEITAAERVCGYGSGYGTGVIQSMTGGGSESPLLNLIHTPWINRGMHRMAPAALSRPQNACSPKCESHILDYLASLTQGPQHFRNPTDSVPGPKCNCQRGFRSSSISPASRDAKEIKVGHPYTKTTCKCSLMFVARLGPRRHQASQTFKSPSEAPLLHLRGSTIQVAAAKRDTHHQIWCSFFY